jgi:hypothetical protein
MIDKLQYRKQQNKDRESKIQKKPENRQTMIDKLQYRKQTNNDRQITIQKTGKQ